MELQKLLRRKEAVVRMKRKAKREQSPDFQHLRKEEQQLKIQIKDAQIKE